MPILMELTIPGMANNPQRVSDSTVSGLTHLWRGMVKSYDNPQLRMRTVYGGFVELGWGSITLNPHLFTAAAWPPPVQCQVKIMFTETTEEAADTIFTGTAHISSHDKKSVTYELYGKEYLTEILPEIIDYDGDTVATPLAIGTVEYVSPTRMADIATAHHFHAGGITPASLEVYDDGVLVAHTDQGDGTFTCNNTPVGDITISGTSSIATDYETFIDYCATQSGIILDKTKIGTAVPLNFWHSTQSLIVDILSEVSEWCTKLFYSLNGINGVVVDMSLDNNAFTPLKDHNFISAPITYSPPYKSIESEWEVPTAGEWSGTTPGTPAGVYVKREMKDKIYLSAYTYGEEMTLTPFYSFGSNINTRVGEAHTRIAALLHKPRINVTFPMSIGIPLPGQSMTVIDDMRPYTTTTVFRARNIEYDLMNRMIIVGGEGEVT